MMEKLTVLVVLLLRFCTFTMQIEENDDTDFTIVNGMGQSDYDDDDELDRDPTYCFRFTWLGPKFDKSSNIMNQTCKTVMKSTKGVPCVQPLVATNNSNLPDTNWMWSNFERNPGHIACRLVKGEVCAKYAFFFNGAVENITYMCAKLNVENGTAVSSGCFREERDARVIEVCVCQSAVGGKPCNSSSTLVSNTIAMIMTAALTWILWRWS